MTDFVQWEEASRAASGKKKSTPAILSRRTTAPTPAMKTSLPAHRSNRDKLLGCLLQVLQKEEQMPRAGVLDMETGRFPA